MTDLLRLARVRALNDEFRADTSHYQFSAWLSLWNLSDQYQIKEIVREYNNFLGCEHDYGSFQYLEQRMYWKIHYYSNDQITPSPDPADHALTVRVLMIVLASEAIPHPPYWDERNNVKHSIADWLRKVRAKS